MATVIYLVSCVIYSHCKLIINLRKQKTWRVSNYQSFFFQQGESIGGFQEHYRIGAVLFRERNRHLKGGRGQSNGWFFTS